jgi:hypothetical protein
MAALIPVAGTPPVRQQEPPPVGMIGDLPNGRRRLPPGLQSPRTIVLFTGTDSGATAARDATLV